MLNKRKLILNDKNLIYENKKIKKEQSKSFINIIIKGKSLLSKDILNLSIQSINDLDKKFNFEEQLTINEFFFLISTNNLKYLNKTYICSIIFHPIFMELYINNYKIKVYKNLDIKIKKIGYDKKILNDILLERNIINIYYNKFHNFIFYSDKIIEKIFRLSIKKKFFNMNDITLIYFLFNNNENQIECIFNYNKKNYFISIIPNS